MNFIKIDDSYINLDNVVTISFDDSNYEINFICKFIDYELSICLEQENYFIEKRCLIKYIEERRINLC